MSLLVKVCGMTRREDVRACVELGVDYLGFIFHPASPRNVDVDFAAAADAGPARKVGLFVNQDIDSVLRIMDQAGLDLAQLHGGQDEDFCKAVGTERVIKALWPERAGSAQALQAEIRRFGPLARHLLFDAGSSGGGHGRGFDHSVLNLARPAGRWFIAGGLGPHNVAQAVAACRPGGVDLNSGVEDAPGVKNHEKIRLALLALRKAMGEST